MTIPPITSTTASGEELLHARAEQLRGEVRAAIQHSDYALAEQLATGALTFFTAQEYPRGQAMALHQLGVAYFNKEDFGAARDAFQRALALREALGDTHGMAATLNMTGSMFVRQGDYPAAMNCLQRSAHLYREAGDVTREADPLVNLASIYSELGDNAAALEAFHKGLALYEAAGEQQWAAVVLNNIANLYLELGNPDEAIRFGQRALDLLEMLGDRYHAALALSIIGTGAMQQGRWETALDCFYRSLEVTDALGNLTASTTILADIGDVLMRMGRYDAAREALERSIGRLGRQGHPQAYCDGLTGLGTLYSRQEFTGHNDVVALRLLSEARQVAEEIDAPKQLSRIYSALSDLHERRGELREALDCQRLLYEIEKRRFNQDSDQRIRSLQVRFEVEKAQQETERARVDAEVAHQRSLELATSEERLRELTQELQRSNEALQEFAHVASHDLKEPLRKIQMFGAMLQRRMEESLGPESLDYLNRIVGAADRMQGLIDDLLAYSRVSAKRAEWERVDLNRVVIGVLSDLETRIAETGAVVKVEPLPEIRADALQMRQLLQNLIGNALKYRRLDTEPRVFVSAVKEAERIVLRVEDNGIGFAPEHAGRLFGIFERLVGRDQPQYEGSGVGLAICKKIVERHGGTITAEGRPGEGAVFTVTLPVAPDKEERPK